MPQSKQTNPVFLTYAHSDKIAVRKLYHRLTRNRIAVWLDEKELFPGQNWKREIRQAILKSALVIVCLSKQFNKQGGYRHEELKIALERAQAIPDAQIFLIPVRLENCDVPEPLRQWQYVSLFEADGFRKLLKTLRASIPNSS
jgi:hypothetical protein